MNQIKINRLIGNAFYSDVEAYLYQEQLEHLFHGIDTDQFQNLLIDKNSYSFVINDYSMIDMRQLCTTIRGQLIIQPRILLFMGDEIESIYNEKGYTTISLVKKGPLRTKLEKDQLLFKSSEYISASREGLINVVNNFQYEHYLTFPYVRDLFSYLKIIPTNDFVSVPQISEKSFDDLKKEGTDNLTNNPHPLFQIIPDVYQMTNINELLTHKDFSSEKLRDQYEEFYSKFENEES